MADHSRSNADSFITEKLYSPLEFYYHDPQEKEAAGDDGSYSLYDIRYRLHSAEAYEFMDAIELAIRKDRDRMDPVRGMAEYLDGSLGKKVTAMFPSVEFHRDELWCVTDVVLSESLTPEELADLKDWWSGQLSDGWGEGFEQREIAVGNKAELYIVPWSSDKDFFIDTQKEFEQRPGLGTPRVDRFITVPETSAQENSTICVNGELKPGDIVLSTPRDEYACLVGVVLSINKAGTPEHDEETDNPGDDVHVNFIDSDYSKRRIGEIEKMFTDLYGGEKSFNDCPIDDVIMAPDTLIRITGIGRGKLAEILDSGEKAAAYCERAIAEQLPTHQTPAYAALHEPDASDGKTTVDLREQLIKRIDSNLSDYIDTLRDLPTQKRADMSSEIAAYTGAHYYLTERHNFHTSELEYLLRFKNPLSVVADQFELESAIEDHSAVIRSIFDRQDALHGDYEFEPGKAGPTLEELTTQVRGRIIENYEAFKRNILETSKENLFYSATEILSTQQAHDYFRFSHIYTASEAAYLLKFENPLELISNFWAEGMGVSKTVDAIFKDQEWMLRHGGYELVSESPAIAEPELSNRSIQNAGIVSQAVNGLIIYAADVVAKHNHKEEGSELVSEARALALDIVHFVEPGTHIKETDFRAEFDAQLANASAFPNSVDGVSPEQKESGLRGLAWYARELISTAGLDSENQVAVVQSMMSKFAERWDSLSQLFERLNGAVSAEIEGLRTAARAESLIDSENVSVPRLNNSVDEKPSVLDRIRRHADEQRNRPITMNDTPTRKKHDQEH